jgi:hypothetical protein
MQGEGFEPVVPGWREDIGSSQSHKVDRLLALDRPDWMDHLGADHIFGSTAFRVLPFAYRADRPSSGEPLSSVLTLAAQASSNKAHELLGMAEATDTVISMAVLVVQNIGMSHVIIRRLRACSKAIREKVNFHFVFAEAEGMYEDHNDIGQPPHSYAELVRRSESVFDAFSCEEILLKGFELVTTSQKNFEMQSHGAKIHFPVNFLRNVAVDYIETTHVMLLDADIVPSAHIGRVEEALLQSEDEQGQSAVKKTHVYPGNACSVAMSCSHRRCSL